MFSFCGSTSAPGNPLSKRRHPREGSSPPDTLWQIGTRLIINPLVPQAGSSPDGPRGGPFVPRPVDTAALTSDSSGTDAELAQRLCDANVLCHRRCGTHSQEKRKVWGGLKKQHACLLALNVMTLRMAFLSNEERLFLTLKMSPVCFLLSLKYNGP